MTMPNTFSSKVILIAAGGVLALGAGAWGISAHFRAPPKPEPVEPEKLFDAMRKPDLSEKERDELRHKMHEAFEARMEERTDEYFKAPEDQRLVILDRHIDEMLKEQEEREARRREREEREGPPPEDRAGPTSRPWRGPGDMTPQERKTRSETRNPDESARRMAYFQAMRERMEARGVQPPHGPGGRRGPGGPGGGHGGPRF
jgi:hypothetical protein